MRRREELLGKNIWEEFPRAVDTEFYLHIRRALEEGVTTEFETVSLTLGAWVHGRAYPSSEGLSVYVQDITERKRAEQAIARVREAERKRIARDLHDGVLQDLSYTAAGLGLLMFDVKGTELEQEMQKAIDAIRRAAQSLRNVVNDLRLTEEGDRPFRELVASLVERNRAMVRSQDIALGLEDSFPNVALGDAGTEALRVLQEALTNARRHSDAHNVWVGLRCEENELVAEVVDDGRGFGTGVTPGVGLHSMRERTALLGGTLDIESEPGRGTRVRLRLPLPQKG